MATTEDISIIGYGRFGQLAARYLAPHANIGVASRHLPKKLPKGISALTLDEAAGMPVVILAVPINAMPAVLRQIAPSVRKDAIVMDVCSVKEKPVEWMLKALPRSVAVVGTHPLFGPDSAALTVEGRNVILCPGRKSSRLISRINGIFEYQGVHTYTMSAAKHDELMASTLFLTQLIGHSVGNHLIPETDATTDNFEKLRQIVLTSKHDTTELFRDMYRYNRFARKIPAQVIKGMERVVRNLSK